MKPNILRFLLPKRTQFSNAPSPAQCGNVPSVVIPSAAMDLLFLFTLALASSLTLSFSANAQTPEKAVPSDAQLLQSYNANREISLVGTVVKYETASTVPPMGAYVTIQTASGQVDVHLGNAKVLQASHLPLNAGDNVRIVGEPLAFSDGTYFAARIVQKGLQAVAVRNARGFPLSPASTLTPAQKEALRGVR